MLVQISSVLGLVGLCVLTFNFLLGLLLSTAYRRSPLWKRLPGFIQSLDLLDIHNWTAYVALALVLAHPLLLPFDKDTHFQAAHVFLPWNAPTQPIWVSMGVLALYAVIVVIVTTPKTLKQKLGFRTWKNIHLVSYLTALLLCLHGLFMD